MKQIADGRGRQRGVTLLEVMIVVVIVGIIAGIAYPSYQFTIGRSWRLQAIACLEELGQGMSRRMNAAMSYVGTEPPPNSCVTADGSNWRVNDDDLRTRYTFAFAAAPTATAWTLQAAPIGAQISNDGNCGTLILDQAGRRTVSGAADVDRCW